MGGNEALRRHREERAWNQAELADRLAVAAEELGESPSTANSHTVSRWETGVRRPGAFYTRLLCHALNTTPSRLGLARKQVDVPADSSDLGPEGETFELAKVALSALDEESIEIVHAAAHRLCRDYSGTPPAVLVPRVQRRLRQLHDLLRRRLGPVQQQRLLTDAGWLHLLLAATHNDIGQREAAWASRDAALALGEEAGDGNVIAWAHETPSWFAISDRRAGEALDYAEAGHRLAPEGSSGWIMNQYKVIQAHARLGDRLKAQRELDQAQRMLERLPEPEFPDHHFVFDPPKAQFYAGTAYVWLGLPELAETSAREVIRTAADPNTRNWVPTRVAFSRLDLADALLKQGRLDEAVTEAERAFTTFFRKDTLVRASEFADALERYPAAREAADLREQVRQATRALTDA